MAGGWYYSHDGAKIGPISGEDLKELAADGGVLPTDTVWKAGVEGGVTADRIKNLFVVPGSPVVVVISTTPPSVETAKLPDQPKPIVRTNKRGTATAIKGADIVSTDITQARYRMKCTECGHKDSSCRTIQISNKLTKTGFFCPKCRKRREVVIQCRTG